MIVNLATWFGFFSSDGLVTASTSRGEQNHSNLLNFVPVL